MKKEKTIRLISWILSIGVMEWGNINLINGDYIIALFMILCGGASFCMNVIGALQRKSLL